MLNARESTAASLINYVYQRLRAYCSQRKKLQNTNLKTKQTKHIRGPTNRTTVGLLTTDTLKQNFTPA